MVHTLWLYWCWHETLCHTVQTTALWWASVLSNCEILKACTYVKQHFYFWNALCTLHCPSSGADSVGHPLSAKELLALKDYILPKDVIESLQQKGLDLNTTGYVQTTIEEVQRRLDSLGQSESASSLRQRLDFGKHLKLVNFITICMYNENSAQRREATQYIKCRKRENHSTTTKFHISC